MSSYVGSSNFIKKKREKRREKEKKIGKNTKLTREQTERVPVSDQGSAPALDFK